MRILDGYEICSKDTFIEVIFMPGLGSQECSPKRKIDVAHNAAFFLLSSVGDTRAWCLYGPKSTFLKLCGKIAKSFFLNKQEKIHLNGSVKVLLPGSVLFADVILQSSFATGLRLVSRVSL